MPDVQSALDAIDEFNATPSPPMPPPTEQEIEAARQWLLAGGTMEKAIEHVMDCIQDPKKPLPFPGIMALEEADLQMKYGPRFARTHTE
jgi:hypothetical protein